MKAARSVPSAIAAMLAASSAAFAQTTADGPGLPGADGSGLAAAIGFGTATAVWGDQILVGRAGEFPAFPMPGSEPGAVHVFSRGADGSWTETETVPAPSGIYGDAFGRSVAVSGGILVVGAPLANEARGAAYVYTRGLDAWDLLLTLGLPDGQPGDEFGASVAVGEGFGIIGVPGRDGGMGIAMAYTDTGGDLASTEMIPSNRTEGGRFGSAVSIEGNLAVVGASGPGPLSLGGFDGTVRTPLAGQAFMFERSGVSWNEVAALGPAGPGPAAFGFSVQMVDGAAFVGAPIGGGGIGEVHVFIHDEAEGWSAAGSLAGDQSSGTGFFGYSLGRAGDKVVAGAPLGASGGAFVLGRSDSGWSVEAMLSAQTTGMQGFMGSAVAGSEGLAVVGAPGSAFFEGVGFVFQGTEDGWAGPETIFNEGGGPARVVGEEMLCGDDGTVAGFPCSDVELVSFLPGGEVGASRGVMVSDVWGWTDPETGREYAILGRFNGTSFVDVTDPQEPVFLGDLPLTAGAIPNLWRDMKVHDGHAFIVADNAGAHGMQVFDLRRLRDVTAAPETFDADAVYDEIHSAHNIVINESTGFAYVVGASGGGETCGGALHMVDIRDPRNPAFAGCSENPGAGNNGRGYTHDSQCVVYSGPDSDYAGREVCFNSSETALGIVDVTEKQNPEVIATASYPNVAYAHQGWLTEDQHYFYLNDELDEMSGLTEGTRTMIWDVSDLEEPVLAREFVQDNAASDHNLYVRDNYMYQSNYVSGLRVFDISDPLNPVPAGYFDTVAGGPDEPGFAGSWSNYPFFESGNILVSSMREGLFILKLRDRTLIP